MHFGKHSTNRGEKKNKTTARPRECTVYQQQTILWTINGFEARGKTIVRQIKEHCSAITLLVTRNSLDPPPAFLRIVEVVAKRSIGMTPAEVLWRELAPQIVRIGARHAHLREVAGA